MFVFLLFYYGRVYPTYGFRFKASIVDTSIEADKNSDIDCKTANRSSYWMPIIGEFLFIGWIVYLSFSSVGYVLEYLSSMQGLETKIYNFIQNRKIRKEFGDNADLYMMVKDNPEAYRKALIEVDSLGG